MAILTLRNVSKFFGDADNGSEQVVAIKDVSLDVSAGEFFSIIGPSGCGKSTLLRIIGGLLAASSGELTVGSDKVNGPHPWLGMVFQEESTFPWRTTLGNVEFGLEMRGVSQDQRRQKSREMIRLVGLSGFEERYPSELSGGMKQRVAIARALVNSPSIVLADEPTGNLDSRTGEEIMALFATLHSQGNTIILVTHEHDIAQHAHRIIFIRDGKIASDEAVKK